MKLRFLFLFMIVIFVTSMGCSGSSGVAPDREGTVVGIVGDSAAFPELTGIATHLESQFGPVAFISPGERPQRMKYLFVTGFLGGENIPPIRDNYFDPPGFPTDMFWPEPLVQRDEGRHMPGVNMIILIARNRLELQHLLRYVKEELDKGKPFDFHGGTWNIEQRKIDPDDVPPRDRQGEWGWVAHTRMAEIACDEMGYNTKVRKDNGAAYAIDFKYDGEVKYTSYITGDETPIDLIIRGSWECDVIHDAMFEGVFENLLYRRVGHAWFPPDGWLGTADDWCYTYALTAAYNFIWNTEGRAYYFLGLSMHLMEDVGIPLHTKADIIDQLLWHNAIEEDLDEYWFDEIDYALPGQPVHSFTDIYATVAELATASNKDFDDLIDGYVWGWLFGYDEYYAVARKNAVRTMGYVKGLLALAEPFTWY